MKWQSYLIKSGASSAINEATSLSYLLSFTMHDCMSNVPTQTRVKQDNIGDEGVCAIIV